MGSVPGRLGDRKSIPGCMSVIVLLNAMETRTCVCRQSDSHIYAHKLHSLYTDFCRLQNHLWLCTQTSRDPSGLLLARLNDSRYNRLTAMEHATPTSAMQPPSAAEIVAPRLNSIPTALNQLDPSWRSDQDGKLTRSSQKESHYAVRQAGPVFDDSNSLSVGILGDEFCDVF